MRPLRHWPLLCVAVLALGAGRPPAADFFPLRAGDWWWYRTRGLSGEAAEFTVTVLRQEKQPDGSMGVVVETATDRPAVQDWYSKAGGWVLHQQQLQLATGQGVTFAPVKRALKNPPTRGDRWAWKGIGAGNVPIESSTEVGDTDTVDVPAGRFRAVRVLTSGTQDAVPVTRTLWYAAGVGLVRAESDVDGVRTVTELMDWPGRSTSR